MAYSSPSEVKIEYDNVGGTPVDISQYVQTINDVDIESVTEEVGSFGDSWEEHLPIGIGRLAIIELGGIFDDIVTVGPDALFADRAPEDPNTNSRTLIITWRTGKTTTFETFLVSYRRTADRNALTQYTARLQPTGAVVEV